MALADWMGAVKRFLGAPADLPAQLAKLLRQRRYQEYLGLYRLRVDEIPESDAHYYLDDVTYVLMALRRYDEALEAARALHGSGEHSPTHARDLARGLMEMGACHWMLGQRSEAIEVWRRNCDGLRRGKYAYARDWTGGVREGLFFAFGAASVRDEGMLTDVHAYLRNRLSRLARPDSLQGWPIPAARFVLGEVDAADMIQAAALAPPGPRDVQEENARRHLSLGHLLAGAFERHAGKEAAAVDRFTSAASIENPLTSTAWHLARFEVEQARSNYEKAIRQVS